MTQPACPGCKRPLPKGKNPFRPFCSNRCKLVDLGKWLDGAYVVPGETAVGFDGVSPEWTEAMDEHAGRDDDT